MTKPLARAKRGGVKKHHNIKIASDGELDEIFASGGIHIERMSDSSFWIGIYPDRKKGLPDLMINTGVHGGVWYFNVEEDVIDGRSFQVRRTKKVKRA